MEVNLILLSWLTITIVGYESLVINEINYAGGKPFVEIAKSVDTEATGENLGNYGILVFEFQRKKERISKPTDFRLRFAADLSGSPWPADNFLLVGHPDYAPHISTNPGQRILYVGNSFTPDFLVPPDKSYLFVVLTMSPNVPLLERNLWLFLTQRGKHLQGDLLTYVTANTVDGVILAGKDYPAKCDRFNELKNQFGFPEDGQKFVTIPRILLPNRSMNRCLPPEILEHPPFAHKMFESLVPSPKLANPCPRVSVNVDPKVILENPDNLEFQSNVIVDDACRIDENNEDPILQVPQEKVDEYIQEKQDNPGFCPPANELSPRMAEVNNALRAYDVEATKIDPTHAKRCKYDDVWEIPKGTDFQLWQSMIRENQDHLINPKLLSKKNVQEWITYYYNEEEPEDSHIG